MRTKLPSSALALALLLAGPALAAPVDEAEVERLRARAEEIGELVAKLRGLDFKAPVQKGIQEKDELRKFMLEVGLSTGFNTQSTFRQVLSHEGGKYDWLGFDDGTRALPEVLDGKRLVQGRPGRPGQAGIRRQRRSADRRGSGTARPLPARCRPVPVRSRGRPRSPGRCRLRGRTPARPYTR